MKKIFASLLGCMLVVLFSCLFFGVYADESLTNKFEILREESDGVVTTRINNIQNRVTTYARSNANDALSSFAESHPYGFDYDLAQNSNYVVYQEQTLSDADASGTWNDNGGYLTIYTAAYHQGYTPSGNARYRVTGEVVFHKTFKLRYQEQLIMNHSANGVFDSSGTESGTMSYHASLHNHGAYVNPPIDKEEDVTVSLTPNYTSTYGVCFKFEWPEDLIQNNGFSGAAKVDIRNVYTNWHLETSYYVIATNDTNVGVTYLHNETATGADLSVSFGAYGVTANISVTKGKDTPYPARPILIYNI